MKLETKSAHVRQADGSRWPVAILGATGAVGQTFIRTLVDHPWFEIAEVAASEQHARQLRPANVTWVTC